MPVTRHPFALREKGPGVEGFALCYTRFIRAGGTAGGRA
jgi:hypothetical protein